MGELYFKEIFEFPIKDFKTHLEDEQNERIIFSGKYGAGKTKFLKDFFSSENQITFLGGEKYEVYRIFPINYSIASNEDILRYIKYDIIIEMLKQSISFDDIELNLIDTFPEYVKKNLHKITAALVYMIPKVGKEVVDIFEKLDKLKEEFLKFHDETTKTNGDKLAEYLETLELKEGSLYETDITTKIIAETVNVAQNKSILLIDDIDRLDPEHVFRILNVFASHFDSIATTGYKNKFNFDKIIIVCDFNNIRNLFHHRYGTEADFNGYMDKFYSSEVYYFDNKKAVISIISKIFESTKPISRGDHENVIKQYYFQNSFFINVLSLFVIRGLLSLRNIIKLYGKSFAYHYDVVAFDNRNTQVNTWNFPIAMQLKLLKDFFGEYYNMKKALEQPALFSESLKDFESHFGDLIYILSYSQHNFYTRDQILFNFHDTNIVLVITYDFTTDRYKSTRLYEWNKETDGTTPVKGNLFNVTEEMFWTALNDTIELLHKKNYL